MLVIAILKDLYHPKYYRKLFFLFSTPMLQIFLQTAKECGLFRDNRLKREMQEMPCSNEVFKCYANSNN